MSDVHNLSRFTSAQESVYPIVAEELRTGRKQSHWMWFIFPQIIGLGGSAMARKYAIRSAEEAQAFLDHPVLGERLKECTNLVNGVEGYTAVQIFAYPDYLKFQSSMTLFLQTAEDDAAIFKAALDKYFAGQPDQKTIDILRRQRGDA